MSNNNEKKRADSNCETDDQGCEDFWWKAKTPPLVGSEDSPGGGKRRLLTGSEDFWFEAKTPGGKRRLLVGSEDYWWEAKTPGGKRRLLMGSEDFW